VRFAVRIGKVAQQPTAALGAESARFGANSAVLVVTCEKLAFCPACGARPRTRLDDGPEELRVAVDPAREKSSRRCTEVGAAEIEPNAAPERNEVSFR
jgi:hypothetical protein